MYIYGMNFCPGEKRKMKLSVGKGMEIPVWRVCGKEQGPTLVVTAGVHGCEFVGIQTARSFYEELDPSTFCGQLLILPLINQTGFYRGSKQIVPEDGENLNRVFPGSSQGTLSQQIAYAIQTEIYPEADFLLDLHGGDINEALTPLLFFPTAVEKAVADRAKEAAMHLPVPYRVRSTVANGLYSYAAKSGIAALLLEIGCGGQWSQEEVDLCKRCLTNLMGYLNMGGEACSNEQQLEGVDSIYEEAEADGFWYPYIQPNQQVQAGMSLGQLQDIDGQLIREYLAESAGVVWYHTTALGVRKGDPLIAYGRCQ